MSKREAAQLMGRLTPFAAKISGAPTSDLRTCSLPSSLSLPGSTTILEAHRPAHGLLIDAEHEARTTVIGSEDIFGSYYFTRRISAGTDSAHWTHK
jgi:hypothetical protein